MMQESMSLHRGDTQDYCFAKADHKREAQPAQMHTREVLQYGEYERMLYRFACSETVEGFTNSAVWRTEVAAEFEGQHSSLVSDGFTGLWSTRRTPHVQL